MKHRKPDAERETSPVPNRQRESASEVSSIGGSGVVASLHRAGGNQAIKQLHERGALQASVEVSRPGDRAEREAERVAEEVLQRDEPAHIGRTPTVTRRTDDGRGEDRTLDSETEAEIRTVTSGGRPLPESTRAFFESRFGQDFSDVRIHTGPRADEAAQSIDAEAFTYGGDIVFRSERYNPHSSEGQSLIAHEITHAVQQGATSETTGSTSGDRGNRTIHRQDAGTDQSHDTGTKDTQRSLPAGAPKRGADSKPREKVKASQTEEIKTARDYEWSRHAKIVTRSAAEWSEFLKESDEYANAIELNFFMAKSVGHDVFKPPESGNERHAQRSWLELYRKPGRNARTNLMAALLTTPEIDLANIYDLGPKQAFLMKRFIGQNLTAGIDKVMQKRKSTERGTVNEFTIKRSWVQTLLSQVGENWRDLKLRRAQQGRRTLMGRRSVSETLLAEAIADAQATAFAALATAIGEHWAGRSETTESGQTVNWGRRRSDYIDEVGQIGEIVGGVALEETRREQLKSTVASAGVDIIAGALGPVAGSIKGIGKQALIQAGVDSMKNGGIAMVQSFGQGGGVTKATAENAMENSLTVQENRLEVILPETEDLPEEYINTKNDLIERFIIGVQ